jgi:hypothetical protein
MTTKSKTQSFFVFQDRSAFLICLFISVLFWVATKFGKQYDQEFTYQLQYDVPQNLAFAEIPDSEFKPTFTGSGWEIFYQGLNKKKHVLPIKLDNRQEQRISRGSLIDRLNSTIKRNLEVKSLNVDFLDVQLEERRTKMVPVVLKGSIPVEEQYVLKSEVTIDPDSVEVSGPSTLVASITDWDLPLPDRAPITQSLSEQAILTPPEDALIEVSPREINLTAEIEALTEKSIYIQIRKDSAIPYRLFPDRVLVTFSVGLSRFHEVSRDSFEVQLLNESGDLQPGAVPVQLTKWPSVVEHVQFSPKSVDVLVVQDTISLQPQ